MRHLALLTVACLLLIGSLRVEPPPADVEQINGEVERFLDIVTQRGARLR